MRVKLSVPLMRRFCKVPGDIFSSFLTSLLFSHFLDAPARRVVQAFWSLLKACFQTLLNLLWWWSLNSFCPQCFGLIIKPVRGNDHLDSLERNGSKVGGKRAKWMTNGSVWSDLKGKRYCLSLGTILKSLPSSSILIYLAGLSSLLAGK